MYSKAALFSMGLPHSGHSGGVRGRSALSMVLSTSTNGTWVTTAPQSSGAWFTTAPIRVPPALAPEMAMRLRRQLCRSGPPKATVSGR